jgi:hypothetical protein
MRMVDVPEASFTSQSILNTSRAMQLLDGLREIYAEAEIALQTVAQNINVQVRSECSRNRRECSSAARNVG